MMMLYPKNLLSYGGDISIKNKSDLTAIVDARTDDIKQCLKLYQANLDGHHFFPYIYMVFDTESGNESLAKLQLHWDATYNDFVQAMPDSVRDKYTNFSIAQCPLNFEENNTTVLTAVCRA
ncbi:unnamed protein product [Rotaria sp. Silwood2]|nr:unnamed protein product [Rotaria sp. Silwood2]CAF4092578.1 unnamed protein product [Rotaria sp. Silwood2]